MTITLVIVVLVVLIIGLSVYFIKSNRSNPTETNSTTKKRAVNKKTSAKPLKTIQKSNGLKIEILKNGSGKTEVKNGKIVTVHYVGTLTDGKKFDSSRDRGKPFDFKVGMGDVIRGWEEGVKGMIVGEKRRLTVPPRLGYGKEGSGAKIPPNATLVFEIELLKIKDRK